MKFRKVLFAVVIASIFFVWGCEKLRELPLATAYSAKYLCSAVFNSHLDAELVRDSIVTPKVKQLPWFWQINIDYDLKHVAVGTWLPWDNKEALAVYTAGKGCTLLVNTTPEAFTKQAFQPLPAPVLDKSESWPHGSGGINRGGLEHWDFATLEQIVEEQFEQDPVAPINTTAVLVIYRGQLIAEHYGLGVTKDTVLLGWSLTKSITATLAGLLWDQGRVLLDEPVGFPSWKDTPKQQITPTHLLHMSSGLYVDEGYEGLSEVSRMLYLEGDQLAHGKNQPVVYPPNQKFQYSTAETGRLAGYLQAIVGNSQQAMYNFYQQALFHPLGMQNAFIEFDAVGNMVGGAYGFLRARDWARLGLLYLQNGKWRDEQLLSRAWIDFAKQPAPTDKRYGAHLWLNVDGNRWPSVPNDAFMFIGYDGQRVVMLPSQDLVLVRLGVAANEETVKPHIEHFLNGVIRFVAEQKKAK